MFYGSNLWKNCHSHKESSFRVCPFALCLALKFLYVTPWILDRVSHVFNENLAHEQVSSCLLRMLFFEEFPPRIGEPKIDTEERPTREVCILFFIPYTFPHSLKNEWIISLHLYYKVIICKIFMITISEIENRMKASFLCHLVYMECVYRVSYYFPI